MFLFCQGLVKGETQTSFSSFEVWNRCLLLRKAVKISPNDRKPVLNLNFVTGGIFAAGKIE
jgi:hypothetical protein